MEASIHLPATTPVQSDLHGEQLERTACLWLLWLDDTGTADRGRGHHAEVGARQRILRSRGVDQIELAHAGAEVHGSARIGVDAQSGVVQSKGQQRGLFALATVLEQHQMNALCLALDLHLRSAQAAKAASKTAT